MIFTVPVAILNLIEPMTGQQNIVGSIYIGALPLLISFGFVFCASLIIGIPVAATLKFFNVENAGTYQTIGGAAGLLLPLTGLLLIGATDGFWISLLGAFAGVITAQTWWRSGQTRKGS